MQVLLKEQDVVSFYRAKSVGVKLLAYILLFNSETVRDVNLDPASQT
jgi:hypothetical protein